MDAVQNIFFEKSRRLMDVIHLRDLNTLMMERYSTDAYKENTSLSSSVHYYQQELIRLEEEAKEQEKRNTDLLKSLYVLKEYPALLRKKKRNHTTKKPKSSRTKDADELDHAILKTRSSSLSSPDQPITANFPAVVRMEKFRRCTDSFTQTEFEQTCFRCPYCSGLISFTPGTLYLQKSETFSEPSPSVPSMDALLNEGGLHKNESSYPFNIRTQSLQERDLYKNSLYMSTLHLEGEHDATFSSYAQKYSGTDGLETAESFSDFHGILNSSWLSEKDSKHIFYDTNYPRERINSTDTSTCKPSTTFKNFQRTPLSSGGDSLLEMGSRQKQEDILNLKTELNALLGRKSSSLSAEIDALYDRLSVKIPQLFDDHNPSHQKSSSPSVHRSSGSGFSEVEVHATSTPKVHHDSVGTERNPTNAGEHVNSVMAYSNKSVSQMTTLHENSLSENHVSLPRSSEPIIPSGNVLNDDKTKQSKNSSRSNINSEMENDDIQRTVSPIHNPKQNETSVRKNSSAISSQSYFEPTPPGVKEQPQFNDRSPTEDVGSKSGGDQSHLENKLEEPVPSHPKNSSPTGAPSAKTVLQSEVGGLADRSESQRHSKVTEEVLSQNGAEETSNAAASEKDAPVKSTLEDHFNDGVPCGDNLSREVEDDSDSFFDESVPVTESSAYHLLLGKSLVQPSAKPVTVLDDSDDSDDIEDKLTSALQMKSVSKIKTIVNQVSSEQKQQVAAKIQAAKKVQSLGKEPDFGVDLKSMTSKAKESDDDGDDDFDI